MLISKYYEILGLPNNSSVEEIKRAYRIKARLYHPDVNQSPDAKDLFIGVTEAYDFLMANHEKGELDDKDYFRAVEDWRKYRQDRSRQRAQYYARSSFATFQNSKYYKSTRILNASSIIFNIAVAITVLVFTVFGFILKLKDPVPGEETRTLMTFILLLVISLILLIFAIYSLKGYIETSKKHRKKL